MREIGCDGFQEVNFEGDAKWCEKEKKNEPGFSYRFCKGVKMMNRVYMRRKLLKRV